MADVKMEKTESEELSLQLFALPILVIAAATAILYFAAPILIPIVLSAALTYLLLPAVNLIKRLKVPHWVAVLIVMLLVAVLFAVISYYLIGELSNLAAALPQYKDKLLLEIQNWNARLKELIGRLPSFLKGSGNLSVDAEKVGSLGRFLLKGVSSLTSVVVSLVVIFFLVLFMLLEAELFKKKFKRIFGAVHAEETEKIFHEVNAQIRGYIQVRSYVFVGLSIATTIGLLILDVQYAYIWGPLAGLLNIIPYIGSIIGAVPPIIVAGIQHNSILYMVYVALFFLILQGIEGNYITPKLTSTTVDLNVVTSLISLTYWGWIWGGIGLFLAIPITAAIKVLCDHIEPLKPIGILMGTERRDGESQTSSIEKE
jgi:AI-2 transport protein TqsA